MDNKEAVIKDNNNNLKSNKKKKKMKRKNEILYLYIIYFNLFDFVIKL